MANQTAKFGPVLRRKPSGEVTVETMVAARRLLGHGRRRPAAHPVDSPPGAAGLAAPRCPELHAQICDEWPDPIAACSGVVSLGRFEGILRLWVELNREVAQEYATLVCHNSDKGAADENPIRVQPRFGPRQMT